MISVPEFYGNSVRSRVVKNVNCVKDNANNRNITTLFGVVKDNVDGVEDDPSCVVLDNPNAVETIEMSITNNEEQGP